jgi:hypothetical protein
MEKNVGNVDVLIRIIIGVYALYLAYTYSLWWLVVAAIALVTASRRSCWLYSLLGIRTNKVAKPVKKAKRK